MRRAPRLTAAVTLLGVAGSGLAQTAEPQPAAPAVLPAGYRVETIPTPPGVAFGVGGLAFEPGGDLLVCTREGEVWRLHLPARRWRRFATGLHEPLGLLVDRAGRILALQRPELTELIDEDGDGRADVHRRIDAGGPDGTWGVSGDYHEYAFGLVQDAGGNLYGTLNLAHTSGVRGSTMGRVARWRGWSFRITPAGVFEPWSCGLRSPAGIGISPEGELFFTDNQGDWNPSSALHAMPRGAFHGHPASLADHPDFAGIDLDTVPIEELARRRLPPAVWFPHDELASSPGQPVWDTTGGAFGPFAGQVFVGDQTRSNLCRVVLERVDGVWQGVALGFLDHLQSGVVRSAFAPDGSLWVGQTGRGWGSAGPVPFGLQRIVWDGETVPFAVHTVRATPSGFHVRFTRPIDAAAAADPRRYAVERWHYVYSERYGSQKHARARVPVDGIAVDGDRRGVRLRLDLALTKVYRIEVDLSAAAGEAERKLANPVAYYTLNARPRQR